MTLAVVLYEVGQMWEDGIINYFKDNWNYVRAANFFAR